MNDFFLHHKGFFAFSDPGGAKAVLSLINRLSEGGFPGYKAISDRNYSFYKNFNVKVSVVHVNDISHVLNRFKPGYIFTGTSHTSSLEVNCIAAAREKKIPSFSFIDHWTSFRSRFKLGNQNIYPDHILVIDQRARELAVLEGIPEKLLSVFPHPYYQWIAKWKPRISKQQFLKRNGIPAAAGKIIAYLPEPLSIAGGIDKFGTDEYLGLEILHRALLRARNKNIILLVKPHPNQYMKGLNEKILNLQSKYGPVMKLTNEDVNTLMYYSDIIAGIFSNALVEASLLKRPVIRILKGLKIEDPLEPVAIGTCLFSEAQVASFLNKHI